MMREPYMPPDGFKPGYRVPWLVVLFGLSTWALIGVAVALVIMVFN